MEFIEALKAYPALLYVTAGFAGLCVGSFLNVVIHRLPRMMEAQWRAECAALAADDAAGAAGAPSTLPPPAETYNLLQPPSRCPSCAAPIRAWQNVPVVSWLMLRGRCANCRAPISFRYPAVEIVAGIAAVLMAWRFGPTAAALAAMAFVWALLALTFIDLDTQLLPDDITLPLLWLGLLVNAFGTFVDLRSAVFGAVGGYLILWLVYWGFRLLAKKEGMGYGDFKLLAALGAWTGWQVLPFIVLVSAGVGAVVGGLLLWRAKGGVDTRIPFGPYLALGGLAGLLVGRQAVIMWIGYFP
jgi:leader peptidase (prepilin peptidase)/N-methyltransferase